MYQNNKYIFIAAGVIILICAILIGYLTWQSSPQNVIERRLHIKLPSSGSIINYEYHNKSGYFGTKILIPNQSIKYVKEQLNVFFGGTAPKKATKVLPDFKNVCSWWDLDEQNIEISYIRFVDEKRWFLRHSHEVWAFISKDKNGQYYLYISY